MTANWTPKTPTPSNSPLSPSNYCLLPPPPPTPPFTSPSRNLLMYLSSPQRSLVPLPPTQLNYLHEVVDFPELKDSPTLSPPPPPRANQHNYIMGIASKFKKKKQYYYITTRYCFEANLAILLRLIFHCKSTSSPGRTPSPILRTFSPRRGMAVHMVPWSAFTWSCF